MRWSLAGLSLDRALDSSFLGCGLGWIGLGVIVNAGDDRSVEDLADGAGFVLSSDLND
jgi:hypothetical protein